MDFSWTPEQQQLREKVIRVAHQALKEGESKGEREIVKTLAREGIVGYLFPQEYGGVLKNKAHEIISLCIIREEFTRIDSILDGAFTAQGLGGYPVYFYGTQSHKDEYLPAFARGDKIPAFAVTEPGAGSDVASISTVAQEKGDFYVLNGEKKFISAACSADVLVVFAKTDPQAGSKGLSAILVDPRTPGVTIKRREIIVPHDNADITFQNCQVPRKNLLGTPGDGFRIAMRNLDIFRTTVGASALGHARAALQLAVERAKERVQFGRPLSAFQAIQFKLADMATQVAAARYMVYSAAWMKDQGVEPVTMNSSMAKLFATEVAFRNVNEAVQIFGGDGVSKGCPVEKLYREVRPPLLYEGTSEIQRIVIARELLKVAIANL
jgi:acyl-CoA dehydrogenase